MGYCSMYLLLLRKLKEKFLFMRLKRISILYKLSRRGLNRMAGLIMLKLFTLILEIIRCLKKLIYSYLNYLEVLVITSFPLNVFIGLKSIFIVNIGIYLQIQYVYQQIMFHISDQYLIRMSTKKLIKLFDKYTIL